MRNSLRVRALRCVERVSPKRGTALAWAALAVMLAHSSPASADGPQSRLTLDQRAGAVLADGRWTASVLQTAVELEARWPHVGIALRVFDYQLTASRDRLVSGTVGVRVPLLARGDHELLLAVDVGGASHRELAQWIFPGGRRDAAKGLALAGALRFTSPVSRHVNLGASVRYGSIVKAGVHWLSAAFVMTVELDRR